MAGYSTFKIPKKKGGFRTIEAPDDELKKKQKVILKQIEREYKLSPFCFGSVKFKNIISNAANHINKRFVVKNDIKDFFNSITYNNFIKIVKDIDKENIKICFKDEKYLAQGSPTSPFLANLYLKSFDWRVAWLCYKQKIEYSRYVDDITFSGDDKKSLYGISMTAKSILEEMYGLQFNKKKYRILRKNHRQIVCGIIVNKKINFIRRLKKLQRLFMHLEKKGIKLNAQQKGILSFMKMKDKEYNTWGVYDICHHIEDKKKIVERLTKG